MTLLFKVNRYKALVRERVRELVVVPRLYKEWRELTNKADNHKVVAKKNKVKSVLILSSHTLDPLASKGDEAMLVAVITKLKQINENLNFSILVEPSINKDSIKRLDELGISVIRCWEYPWKMSVQFGVISQYDSAFCLGADVMDGYYSAIKSLRLWMLADLMARCNKVSVVGGFSFNSSPSKYVLEFLSNHASKKIDICLRDNVSLMRFHQLTRLLASARLVADNAFMLNALKETAYVENLTSWINKQKSEEQRVLAFNMHPMLIRDRNPAVIQALVDSSVKSLKTIIETRGVSFVLLPHDFRDSNTGDLWFLRKVYDALSDHQNRLFFVEKNIQASEIKGVASEVELVVTGRMHLSIAALGAGTPILGVTYQGKFEGLIKHFSLPDGVLSSPKDLLLPERFTDFINFGLDNSQLLRAKVADKLSDVKEKSVSNLTSLC